MAKVIEQVDPRYLQDVSTTFFRVVGSKGKQHGVLLPMNGVSNAALNAADRTIRFNENLKSYFYDFQNMGVLLTFKNQTAAAAPADYLPGNFLSIISDGFFSTVRVKVGTEEINYGYGFKDRMHKWAHLSKLMRYNPTYAKMVEEYEYFYPDTGEQASCDRRKFTVNARVGTLATNVVTSALGGLVDVTGITQNTILVGHQGTVGAQASAVLLTPASAITLLAGGGPGASSVASLVDITTSVSGIDITTNPNFGVVANSVNPDGNPLFFIDDNKDYNKGFYARTKRSLTSAITTVWIPLKYYCPALEALGDVLTGVTLDVLLQRPLHADYMFSANKSSVAASVIDLPALGLITIEKCELHIPILEPDDERRNMLISKITNGITDIRKYIDVDIMQSSVFPVNTTTVIVDHINIIDRTPVAVFFGFQYAGENDKQTGNPHRYFNPKPSSSSVRIGNGASIPLNPFVTVAGGNDYVTLYRAFMDVCDIMGTSHGNMIDYQSFLNHKFLFAFDLRQIDKSSFNLGANLKLTFNCNIAGSPVVVADDNGANGRFVGSAQTGPFHVWTFLLMERALQVTQTSGGTTIRANVLTSD